MVNFPHIGAMDSNSLLDDIKNWITEKGLAESTFGRLAINDGKLVSRLSNGGQCLPSTEQKIRNFMSTYTEAK